MTNTNPHAVNVQVQPFFNDSESVPFRVIKRGGDIVEFDINKIAIAMFKSFIAVEGAEAANSNRIREQVAKLSQEVVTSFQERKVVGAAIGIEEIQDRVELVMMRSGEHKAARSYVLYREAHNQLRAREEAQANATPSRPTLRVKQADGSLVDLDVARLDLLAEEACRGLPDTNPIDVVESALKSFYDGISAAEVSSGLTLAARALVEREPNYTYVTSLLAQDSMRREAVAVLVDGNDDAPTFEDMRDLYPALFSAYISKGIELEQLDPRLAAFDLFALGNEIDHSRDRQFTYLAIQTLYDRYLLHTEGRRYELPQYMFMRVSMGLALEQEQPTQAAIRYYHILSSFRYMTSTPTLFNSGTLRSQLSSCYLTTVPDDLESIYGAITDNAMLSKWAGGLGNDWTPVRALGSRIKGTNGKSQGIVPFLKVVNDTAVAVNQGGKRKGAVCAYVESFHLDIEEFLELRKNTGDDRRRTHDMNTANWIPDLFLKRVEEEGTWTLFSPSTCPDLHDLYGAAFERRYAEYEKMVDDGLITLYKRVQAKDLWRKMLTMVFETGHPWITFKDPCNLRSPQQHAGVVHSSNLCTEITLNTSVDEIAVCNLGSVNLLAHIVDGELDEALLRETVRLAVEMLDNVIDINYYAVEAARRSNLRHRPVGLGMMGFQDALYAMNIPYGSADAVAFADSSMELISYFAIEASCELAVERGTYESYEGSLWSQGILPIDSIRLQAANRGAGQMLMDTSSTLDWDALRALVQINGMRNSNVMAIAPTATISNICGVTQSIEPTYQNLFVKSNLSGEFTVINHHMVHTLKAEGLWDEVMINDLKYYDGSLMPIARIPDHIKDLYATAFEIDHNFIIEAASRRQKWIDQSQSLNLYIAGVSGKKLHEAYMYAWKMGLKTTYYLRAQAASRLEKSTLKGTDGKLSGVATQPVPMQQVEVDTTPESMKFCALDDPDCEACQ